VPKGKKRRRRRRSHGFFILLSSIIRDVVHWDKFTLVILKIARPFIEELQTEPSAWSWILGAR
jgi:hypothetical protein